MELKELEAEVDDLEPRLERLRALYEQYFMGLEKIEPGTLRAEVERKFWQLRKQRVQNTGLRFRLQMLIQRYNSYQQYWARVTREMERGTYMRDILRVAKRIGSQEAITILGRRRSKMFRDLARAQEQRLKRRRPDAASGPDGPTEHDGPQLQEQEPTPGARPDADAVARPDARLEDPSTWNIFDEASAGDDIEQTYGSAPQAEDEDERRTWPPPAPGGGVVSTPQDEDLDEKRTLPPPPRTPALASAPVDEDLDEERTWPPRPAPQTLEQPQRLPSERPATTAKIEPTPSKRPLPPPRRGARTEPMALALAEARAAEGSEQTARRLYDDYVAAKQRGGEPVEGLTFEKLRRSLERQAEHLRASHGVRRVDFEVVTVEGRTMIRPLIK